jgi:hypothetical protein
MLSLSRAVTIANVGETVPIQHREKGVKIKFDIDCTPEEARSFLGLPDVAPLQGAMMEEVEKRMKAALDATSPEALLNRWLPAGMQNLEDMQKIFWAQFQGGKKDQ